MVREPRAAWREGLGSGRKWREGRVKPTGAHGPPLAGSQRKGLEGKDRPRGTGIGVRAPTHPVC